MTIDVALLGVIAFFALLGALSGAAKQIANVVAMILAYALATPVGHAVAPRLAPALKMPLSVAVVAGTLFVFIIILVVTRIVLSQVLRRLFAGSDPDSRALDRILGAVLGGAKVALLIWFFLCALAFVEENVTFAGKKIGVSPKESIAFRIARSYNVFELQQFAPVKDLIHVAQALGDPDKAAKLKSDPAFQRLQKDPRFKDAMNQPQLDTAFENGDYRALLKSTAVMNLIQDPNAVKQLEAASESVP